MAFACTEGKQNRFLVRIADLQANISFGDFQNVKRDVYHPTVKKAIPVTGRGGL
jgi:hypothetical protein